MANSVLLYKFGPFELRPRTLEFYREGIKLKVRPQAVHGQLGDRKKALAALQKLKNLNQQQQRDPAMFVIAYLGLGDREETFRWLQKSLERHSNVITTLKVDPIYDPLRSDPRFIDILQQSHLDN